MLTSPSAPYVFFFVDLKPVDTCKLEMDCWLEKKVLKEGNGLQLGFSPGMEEFFNARGPFIGKSSPPQRSMSGSRTFLPTKAD